MVTIHLSEILPHLFFFYLLLNFVFYCLDEKATQIKVKKFNNIKLILNPFREFKTEYFGPYIFITVVCVFVYFFLQWGFFQLIENVKIVW